ncbi:MAG: NnrS family protein [Vulcanimicrobiota bacterium]
MKALFSAGFRPFFLAAGLTAAGLVPAWLAVLSGHLPAPGYYGPLYWHSHEMVFGFGTAMLAGFLLTAVPNWTGARPLQGWPLVLLVAAWGAARLGPFFGSGIALAVVDLAFLPMLGVAVALPVVRQGNPRTLIFLPILAALWLCDLGLHLELSGLTTAGGLVAVRAGVGLFVLLIAIIGGRVIPFFTRAALPQAPVKSWPLVEGVALATAALVPVLQVYRPDPVLVVVWAALAVAAHGARLWGWWSRPVARLPLLWVLFTGYLWLLVGIGLQGALAVQVVSPGAALHAFTAGAMGVVGLAIMARASLGHSGRALVPSRVIVLAFVLANGAALARVGGWLNLAGALWTVTFLLFVAVYLPIWCSPRADGKA